MEQKNWHNKIGTFWHKNKFDIPKHILAAPPPLQY